MLRGCFPYGKQPLFLQTFLFTSLCANQGYVRLIRVFYHFFIVLKAYTFPPKSVAINVLPDMATELNTGAPVVYFQTIFPVLLSMPYMPPSDAPTYTVFPANAGLVSMVPEVGRLYGAV